MSDLYVHGQEKMLQELQSNLEEVRRWHRKDFKGK